MRVGNFNLALTLFSVSCLGFVCLFFLPMRGLAAGGGRSLDTVHNEVEYTAAARAASNAEGPTTEREYQQALALATKSYGGHHENVGRILNHLAVLYKDTGRLAEAEPLLERSLRIYEARLGPDHPDVAQCCQDLLALQTLLELNQNAAEADRANQSGADLQSLPVAPTISEYE